GSDVCSSDLDAWLLGKLPDGLEPLDGAPQPASCSEGGAGCAPLDAAGQPGEGTPSAGAGGDAAAVPAAPVASRRTPALASDRNPAGNSLGSWIPRQPHLLRQAPPAAGRRSGAGRRGDNGAGNGTGRQLAAAPPARPAGAAPAAPASPGPAPGQEGGDP